MYLDTIYLTNSLADELFNKLEEYNSKHPDEKLTAQQLAEKILEHGIRWTDTKELEV